MIICKERYMEGEIEKLNPRLIRILDAVDALVEVKHGCNLVITSVYREEIKSVHMYFRGVDATAKELSHKECLFIANIINLALPYDKENYQTVLYHDAGSGWHFHMQVKA